MNKHEPIPNCPVKAAVDVIGGRWKVVILWQLREGHRRFNELQRLVPGITQRMLVKQLRELENHGIVERKAYPQVPPRVEYFLTRRGKALSPILESLARWGSSV